MFRILVIEDHADIAENIAQYLALEHYQVDIAPTGTAWRALFSHNTYDVIVLDLMLPGIDGITLCNKIKALSDTPIIMTTAKWQLEDKLEGFGVGADDYLVKPFDLAELSARITALLRRQDKFDVFTRGDLRIDLTKRTIFKHDEEVYLTIKEFYLLEILIQHYGFPVSRADIISHVRGEAEIREESGKLDVYISNLRKKLDKSLIDTIPGFGYKIEKNGS
jgi:DNA-binding response OmpR family regulator